MTAFCILPARISAASRQAGMAFSSEYSVCLVPPRIPKTNFSCEGRSSGYYADVTSGCQLYHMCDGLGRQFSYTCPNATLFQQRMLICDHWYMVNCSRSEDDYSANLLIGQNKPFVEDSGTNPYYRTPRPDLLSHPASASEYNTIYRSGNDYRTSKNIVGIEQESQQSTYSDEPTYFPPSHWSTEYPSHATTDKPNRSSFSNRRDSNQNNSIKTNYPTTKKIAGSPVKAKQPKAINFSSSNRNGNNIPDSSRYKTSNFKYNPVPTEVPVNYQSNFKATTPVFPLVVPERPTPTEESIKYQQNIKFTSSELPKTAEESSAPTELPVNYKSNFRATTPVFPLSVEDSSVAPNEIGILPPIPYRVSEINRETEINTVPESDQPQVNFKSNFKATTPVYPTSVEPKNYDVELRAPDTSLPKDSQVNFVSDFKATTPVYPTSVEPTSPDPGEVGLLPPQSNATNIQEDESLSRPNLNTAELSLSIEPPKFDERYKENKEHLVTTVEPPSMFYQPPKSEPDFTSTVPERAVKPGIEIENIMKSLTREQWQNLRQRFHIPEYDFPLDDATRPSYDSILSSFVVKPPERR